MKISRQQNAIDIYVMFAKKSVKILHGEELEQVGPTTLKRMGSIVEETGITG